MTPSKHPDEVFDLYSVPAFDARTPDVLPGRSIGSAKQVVQPGDVLLSRIVPHIRRAWVVGDDDGRRIVASGEWIVFRSEGVYPDYLKHVLVSDPFHAQFMRTVSGVGGSLLRARPSHVAQISIPVPPLAEQRRIAEVLDRAEALRAKRRAALAQLDTITQALFLDLFGDPARSTVRTWEAIRIRDVTSLITKGTTPTTLGLSLAEAGIPFVRAQNLVDGVVNLSTDPQFISVETHQRLSRSVILPGDILVSIAGTIGRASRVMSDESEMNCNQAVAILRPTERVLGSFLLQWLQERDAQHQMRGAEVTGTISNLSLSRLAGLHLRLPPLHLQQEFDRRVATVDKLKATQRASLAQLDALFASLQHRAFRGEL